MYSGLAFGPYPTLMCPLLILTLRFIVRFFTILATPFVLGGPGSSVGIATGYGLDGPGIESRWGARFSATAQTGPGAHPASCTMGTGSLQG